MQFSAKSALFTATALSLGLPVVAHAQNDSAPLEEIVVTARRVEERLQKVPIAITVFNQKQLDQRNITTGADLAQYTPSLSVQNEFGSTETAFSLRGFYQQIGTLPTVAVYFADAISPRGGIGGQEEHGGEGAGPGSFFDLQNVQVLKGPQGTLFGRNTTGGAILLVPQKPTDQFEGYLDVEFGNYDMKRVQAVLNLPVNDKIRLRFGVDHQERDGYENNISGVGPSAFGDVDYLALRASALVDITDDIQNYTVIGFSRSKDNAVIEKIVSCAPGGGLAAITGAFACAQIARDAPFGTYAVDNISPESFNYSRQLQIINTTTWDLNDNLTFKNIAQYAEWVQNTSDNIFGANFITPAAFGPLAGLHITLSGVSPPPNGEPFSQQNTVTEEMQLQGRSFSDKLHWTTGLYMETSQPLGLSGVMSSQLLPCTDIYKFQCTDVLGAVFSAGLGLPLGSITIGGVNPGEGEQSWHDYGIFGQATYEITDELKVTAGLRWSDDITNAVNTKFTYQFTNVFGAAPTGGSFPSFSFPPGTINKICSQGVGNATTDELHATLPGCTIGFHNSSRAPTGTIDLEYAPTDDINTYVKYSRGYRAAGISPDGPVGELNYGAEQVDNYEVGVKTAFHGVVSGIVDFAAFYNNFDNQQLPEGFESLQGASSTIATLNAPKSTIKGLEIEGVIVPPVKGVSVTYGYTYLDARLDEPPSTNINTNGLYSTSALFVKGEPLPFTPRHKATLAVDYLLPIDESIGKVTFSLNYTYTAKQLVQAPAPAAFTFIPENSIFNLNVAWEKVFESPVDVSFFITNLFDRRIVNNVVDYVGQGLGWDSVGLAPPRMFGGRVKYSFGGSSEPAATPAAFTPPPVQAPAPAPHSYLVFFDFDKSDLTPQATQIVDEAAKNAGPAHVTRITCTGHTDTVGSAAYNMRLSKRRAESVASELEKEGIPSSEIEIVAKGKTDPLVATGDGVKEPQNRRVQIVYEGGPTS